MRPIPAAAVLSVLVVLVAGCGTGPGTTGSPIGPATSISQPPSTASASAPATVPIPAVSSPAATPDPLAAVSHPMSDLESTRLEVKVPVGHSPDWQVGAFGSVWVATGDGGTVERIDTKTNAVVASIPIPSPCLGMGAGFGSVWVPDCSSSRVARIDPKTNKVVAFIQVPFSDSEGQIAVGTDAVWVPDPSGSLSRIDPKTNRVTDTYQVGAGLASVVAGFGSLWATRPTNNTTLRIDSHGTVIATIRVASGPRFLTADPSGIWVLGQGDGAVSWIDPATNQVAGTVALAVPGEGGCIAAGGGSVWVTMPNTPVSRIDARTGQVLERFMGAGGDCIGFADGSVWLSNGEFGDVWRIKP